jgi:2-C-methyl-D-erythritol 2,4-cyclodiphosphate synthase
MTAVVRTGLGRDSHPFGPDDGLALGGIRIEGAPRLVGHSDGDVALHAVADALLGAAALGDLGRLFPAGDGKTKGIASASLLERVLAGVADAGYEPIGVDVTIVGARPTLAEYLGPMREAIAAVLGVPPEQVSVKASSGNLAGDEGAGRVVSAHAVATIASRDAR